METRAAKAILPTDLNSRMIAQLPKAVRERAIFSAGVQNVDFLNRVRQAVDEMVHGSTNRATERTALRALAEELEAPALQSDSRLNLILDTQVKMSNGFGSWIEGQHPAVLLMWPAQELYRAEERKEPRDWPSRWADAGGEFFPGDSDYPEGRMIALKNDDIWEDISAFDQPYAPFDYNSGMDLRDIDRDEAVDLGLIDPDDTENPEERGFNQGLKASVGIAGNFGLGLALGEFLGGIARVGTDGMATFIGAGH
jgi:hypothetical protein